MGRFALDKATPVTDLKLLVHSVSGNKSWFFPKGGRIIPLEVTSLLSGNQKAGVSRERLALGQGAQWTIGEILWVNFGRQIRQIPGICQARDAILLFEKVDGGGCSLRQTRLSHEFPGIREFCREMRVLSAERIRG